MRATRPWYFLLLCAALCGIPVSASADNFSFTGMFTADDQMVIFQFVASASQPVITSLGYNGGTNAKGTVIPAGGFVTDLSLFGPDTTLKPTTLLIGADNSGFGDAQINTASPPIAIIPGDTYWVVLTEFDNSANGPNFGGGFHEAGNGNFSGMFGCGAGPFCDPNTLTNRDGNWALDITGVTSAQEQQAAVPEPATFLMLGTAIAGVLAARRLKSARRQSS